MKQKLLKTLVLLCALIVGSATSWAETYTWKCADRQLTTSTTSFKVGDVTWSFSPTWSDSSKKYVKWSGGSSNWYQIGSKNNVMTSLSIATSSIAGTITNVQVVWSSAAANASSLAVSVGSTNFTSTNSSSSSSTLKTSSFEGSASGTLNLTFTCTTGIKIQKVVVKYEAATIDVTGVSLNKTTTTIETRNTETLTATIAPANASNKNVSWSSSNVDVATVEDGVVTAVSVGTATITVTTEDGSYTAKCDVTVTKAPVAAVTLDFTSNDWGIGEAPTKTVEANEFTKDGYTITLQGSTENGYYFDTDNIMLGKSGASLTLPAFPFNVKKIKVYGVSGASGSVTFNVFVGEDKVSTEATSSKVTHEFEIASEKQDAGTVYIIKVTNAYNMRISKIEVFGYEPVTVSEVGYATYCSANALDFTGAGVKAYVGKVSGGNLTFTPVTEVPTNTGLLLYKEGSATVNVPVIASADPVVENCLTGVNTATTISSEDYILNKVGENVGFYKAGKFTSLAAHRAYISASAGIKNFVLNFDETDGIVEIMRNGDNEKMSAIFDLSGRRVSKPTKGIYVKNGRKFIVK